MAEISPSDAASRGNGVPVVAPANIQWQWLPAALAILALLLLLVVPSALNRRVTALQNELLSGSEHARVLLNDLEAAFASELLVRTTANSSRSTAIVTAQQLDSDATGLHEAVRDLGSRATALEYDLAVRLASWKMTRRDDTQASLQEGLDLLASAERLDSYLTVVSADQRTREQRLERFYVITPALLAPVAVVAILIVVASARRERRFALFAQEERTQFLIASEARAALLRGVTHDVKNPLGAAAGYAQLLEEGLAGDLHPKQLEMVTRIRRLVNTAVQTVADLLELARADGDLHLDYATIDLGDLVKELVRDNEGLARAHDLKLCVEAPPTTVVTDPVRVQQILTNLVSNAIKYTGAGGQVRVSLVGSPLANTSGRIGIEVRDTGPGIPHELQAKIFEEFFRVRDRDSNTADSNGLGLAISRRLARLLGGDVAVGDAEGGGAVFTLWLPSGLLSRGPGD